LLSDRPSRLHSRDGPRRVLSGSVRLLEMRNTRKLVSSGPVMQVWLLLDRDDTAVDALRLRAVQFLSTYPPCSIGISTPEGVVHIGPRNPPSSSEWGVAGKCALVRRRP
jgi:hypothetical protein